MYPTPTLSITDFSLNYLAPHEVDIFLTLFVAIIVTARLQHSPSPWRRALSEVASVIGRASLAYGWCLFTDWIFTSLLQGFPLWNLLQALSGQAIPSALHVFMPPMHWGWRLEVPTYAYFFLTSGKLWKLLSDPSSVMKKDPRFNYAAARGPSQ